MISSASLTLAATVTLHAPRATLHVAVARSAAQREHGLMGVPRLPPHIGMLFIFPGDAPVAFWMKNTLVPLDMVFISASGDVRSIAPRVPAVPADTPDDRIPRRYGSARYVIELAAGEAAKDGIESGTHIGGLPARAP